jgi:hypothetical protein
MTTRVSAILTNFDLILDPLPNQLTHTVINLHRGSGR